MVEQHPQQPQQHEQQPQHHQQQPQLDLRTVRDIKNALIGNRFKKREYAPLAPALLAAVSKSATGGGAAAGDGDGGDDGDELAVQALAAVGSLAYGAEEGARAVVAAGGVGVIVAALRGGGGGEGAAVRPAVVVAAARALKQLCQSPLAPRAPLLEPATLRRLVQLLREPPQPCAAEAAAAVLAHCCAAADEARAVADAGALPALLPLLASPLPSTQEAAVEALGALTWHCPQAAGEALRAGGAAEYQQQQHQQQQGPSGVLEQLLHLSKQRDARLRYQCARCISNLATHVRREEAERAAATAAAALVGAGAKAAADTATTTGGDAAVPPGAAQQLLRAQRAVLPGVVRLLSEAADAAAGADAAGGAGAGARPRVSFAGLSGPAAKRAALAPDAVAALAAGDRAYLLDAPRVLAMLTFHRNDLQRLAVDLDAIKLLARLLLSAAPADDVGGGNGAGATAAGEGARDAAANGATAAKAAAAAVAAAAAPSPSAAALALRRGCLSALSSLAQLGDAARQQIVDARLVPRAVALLSDGDAGVRGGAAMLLRRLSRSVRLLRAHAIPASAAGPLVALLHDAGDTAAQAAAAAAAANLLLGFGDARAALVRAGALPALLPLLGSMEPELRLYAAWAVKNLTHACDPALQRQLQEGLPWPAFVALLARDDDARVRAQAVGALQNLCKGGDGADALLGWSGGALLPLLEEQLAAALLLFKEQQQQQQQQQPGVVGSTAGRGARADAVTVGLLYAVANLCCGSDAHKEAVMASRLPRLLLGHMQAVAAAVAAAGSDEAAAAAEAEAEAAERGGDSGGGLLAAAAQRARFATACEVGLAATWCVINLLYREAAAPLPQQQRHAGSGGGDDDGGGGSSDAAAAAADAAARAAADARAAALRQLGFEGALSALRAAAEDALLLEDDEPGTGGASDDGADSDGGGGSDDATAGVRAVTTAAAAAVSQDLAERVSTALEQLGAGRQQETAAAAAAAAAADIAAASP